MTPLMLAWRLDGRHVVLVGGGTVAADRLASLQPTGARVTLVAPRVRPRTRPLLDAPRVHWLQQPWSPHLLESLAPDLVLVAVDDPTLSTAIAEQCRNARIPVNVADQPPLCDVYFASVHRDGPLQVAVSTNGAGPGLAARIRRELAASLHPHTTRALRQFARLRQAVRTRDPSPEAAPRRMSWLRAFARQAPWQQLATLDVDTALATYPQPPPRIGHVTLVGAGPGDPSLLTMAAHHALMHADLVLADRLVPTAITDLARGPVRVARKHPGRAEAAQAELHRWMLEGARAGLHVVRLKCGDPFLFGRGAEELAVLDAAGIPASVVPGVSSALAAPLLARIAPTTRGVADRVVISTGRGAGGRPVAPPPFRPDTTAVFLMSVGRLPDLVDELLGLGWPPDWPTAAIERASHPDQRVLRAPLAQLATVARARDLQAPAVIVVGRAANPEQGVATQCGAPPDQSKAA